MKLSWLHYLSYAVLLVISLALQLLRPEMFALFCTQLPIGNPFGESNRLELPLNSPIVPMERVK